MEHTPETKNCQNCKNDFTVESEDFSFYEKMQVPAPTWCSLCRFTRRIAFINAWTMYFRKCDLCGEKTMSMYHPDSKLKLYCQPCWWSDKWDGTEYAMDYDPSRNFLEQVFELKQNTPFCALETTYLNLKNSEYTNAISFAKNCYLVFWADYCENVFYSSLLNTVKDSLDLLRVFKSELSYESVGVGKSSKVFFSDTCDDCVDVWFSRNCYGCMNVVGCVNLRGKSYMIFNQQYSKEEYFEKLKEFKLDTREGIKKLWQESQDFWQKHPYREYTGNPQNLNVSGDYIFESKNAKDCYISMGVEDSKYVQFATVLKTTNCMDYSGWGNNASMMYECASMGEDVSNSKFSFYSFPDVLGLEYSMHCISGKNNFGCVNLKRKKYAILNKEYSKEEYEILRAKIIEDMTNNPYIDSKGRIYKYGEFFPVEFSSFPYNDSNASRFTPKTKEEAISEGYNWIDKPINNYTVTIKGLDLPQTIEEVDEEILKEVVGCTNCNNGFRFTGGELNLYKKLNLPLSENCPKCREERRFNSINKPYSFESNCMKCNKEITTMHNPKDNKIIYCVSCYQQEIL